ncbi:MAG: quinol oxidase subunit 4 [Cytophagales bacterium]|nr:quinol oxidase subunit 4 [Cytophagales bacterium]
MKSVRFLIAAFVFCLSVSACTVVRTAPPPPTAGRPAKPLPPGQAKKVYGTQSAKPFAPGQQKKRN